MVTRVLNLLYREVRGLHQAAYVLALFTLASQVLEIVRDRILAHQFGAGYELDIYYTAFRIPDVLYVLFASVLSVYVLLPFVSRARTESEGAGSVVLAQMFTFFLVVYTTMAVAAAVAAPLLVPLMFPGFKPEAYGDIVLLLRILLLQPFFLGISSLFGVVTQIHQRFVLYALSPLLYNIGIIVGAVCFYPAFGLVGLAYGVVLGAAGHMLVQWPLVRGSELSFGIIRKIDWALLRSIAVVAVPRAVTLSLGQLQFLFFVTIASLMTVGSVAILQFSYNLQSVPLAIIGMSYSVAAFPVLAELLAKQQQEKFVSYVLTATRHIIFWSTPIIALVIVLRAQLVRVLLGSGSFNWDDTRLTAAALAIFMLSLVGQSIMLLFTRAFYAGGHTRIPLVLTLIGTLVGMVASGLLYFVVPHHDGVTAMVAELLRIQGVAGVEILVVPIGYVVGTLVQTILMFVLFARVFGMSWQPLWRPFWQSLLASIAGGAATYVALLTIVDGVNQEKFLGIFLQGLVGGLVGLLTVVLVYEFLKSEELFELTKSFRAKLFKTDVVAPQPDILP